MRRHPAPRRRWAPRSCSFVVSEPRLAHLLVVPSGPLAGVIRDDRIQTKIEPPADPWLTAPSDERRESAPKASSLLQGGRTSSDARPVVFVTPLCDTPTAVRPRAR